MAIDEKYTSQHIEPTEDLTYYSFQETIVHSTHEELIHMRNHYEKQLFNTLQCYDKNKKFEHQIQRRVNKFVFCPGIPYPYACNGNTKSKLYTFLEHLVYSIELVKGAKETIRLLSKQRKGNYCPYLIFIPMNHSDYTQNHYTYKNHEKHVLLRYSSKIIKESQFALEFHITSHGNHDPPGIDTLNPIKVLTPQAFAMKFNTMLIHNDLDAILKDKEIKFTFHTCNGAYCALNGNETMDEIQNKVKTETFIGQFRTKMMSIGYTNIIVTGYRGYYQTMCSGSGVRVGNKLNKPTKDIDSKQVEFTIYSNGYVDVPKCYDFQIDNEY
eukprot:156952_1